MSNDTTTTLNPGVGGDVMDESSVVQADGSTTVKRTRVDVGFSGPNESQASIVGKDSPLPSHDEAVLKVLTDISNSLNDIKEILISSIE